MAAKVCLILLLSLAIFASTEGKRSPNRIPKCKAGGCYYNGACYKQGHQLRIQCLYLKCQNKRWIPMEERPEDSINCELYALVSLSLTYMFDGNNYHFSDPCRHVVAQIRPGNANETSNSAVYADFKTCAQNYSCWTGLHIKSKEDEVEVDPFNLQTVKVNGRSVALKNSTLLTIAPSILAGYSSESIFPSNCSVFATPDFVLLLCAHFVILATTSCSYDRAEGLCGRFNYDDSDDFKDRDGVLRPVEEFVTSWRNSSSNNAVLRRPPLLITTALRVKRGCPIYGRAYLSTGTPRPMAKDHL